MPKWREKLPFKFLKNFFGFFSKNFIFSLIFLLIISTEMTKLLVFLGLVMLCGPVAAELTKDESESHSGDLDEPFDYEVSPGFRKYFSIFRRIFRENFVT